MSACSFPPSGPLDPTYAASAIDQRSVWRSLLARLADDWRSVADRLDETPQSTLRALWFAAAGDRRAIGRLDDALPSLGEDSADRLHALVQRRLAGVPLSYLTGRQAFLGLELLAGPEALIPRSSTELLTTAAIAQLQALSGDRGPVTAVDLCTGSGNIALALAYYCPGAQIFASDISEEAVSLAQRNAEWMGLAERVTFAVGDLFDALRGRDSRGQVDLITCNPPFIPSSRVAALPPEVRCHEPLRAFDGGTFGLEIIIRLYRHAPEFLRPGSWLCFEVGAGQGAFIAEHVRRSGHYAEVRALTDARGEIRGLMARTQR